MVFANILKNEQQKRCIKYGEWTLLVLSPILLLLAQSLLAGTNLFMGVPVWTDELDYWREMYSFVKCGLGFGGSSFVGMDATFGPLGAHSFSPMVAWLPFFFLFSSSHAIVWANLFLLCLAWLLCVMVIKPDINESLALLLTAYAYPMILLYLHSSMIEIACLSGMIAYYVFFRKWELSEDKKWFWLTLLVGIWVVAIRPPYIVILFTTVWKKSKFGFNIRAALYMVVYVVLFGAFYKLFNYFCADYPTWITYRISNAVGIKAKLAVVYYNAMDNLRKYFSPRSADLSQVSMRYFFFLIVLLLFALSIIELKKKVKTEINFTIISLFVVTGGFWTMMITLYDIIEWTDYRFFSSIGYGVFLYLLISRKDRFTEISLGIIFSLVFVMYVASDINFIEMKGPVEEKDLSEYFEVLKVEDESGKPLTIAADISINWADISVMKSVPAKMGYQIFDGGFREEYIGTTEYVFLPPEFVVANPDIIKRYEEVVTVPGYGTVYTLVK